MNFHVREGKNAQGENLIQSSAVYCITQERKPLRSQLGRAFLAALISVSLLLSAIPSAALATGTDAPSPSPVKAAEKVQETHQPADAKTASSPAPSPTLSPAPSPDKKGNAENVQKEEQESSGIKIEDAEPAEEETAEDQEAEEIPAEPIDGVARVIANFMCNEMGLRNAATSAVLYAIQCKCNFSPTASYDGGTSFGICQWSGSRLQNLKQFCEDNSLDCNTVTAQLRFMREELVNVYPDLYESMAVSSNTDAGTMRAAKAFDKYCTMDQDGITVKNPNSGDNALTAENYFAILSEEEGQENLMSLITAEIVAADFFRNEMGFNNAVTAGIMANIYDESGFRPDTLGDGGTAYGICQWGPFRRKALERFCRYNEYDVTTLGAQLLYLKVELESDYPKTLDLLMELEDNNVGTREAARLFCKNIEVPSNLSKQVKERQKLAEQMYFPMLNGEEYERIPVDEIMKDNSQK